MILTKYKLIIAVMAFFVAGSALSSTDINNRVSVDLDGNGKLTINSGYLSNYIFRGVDPKTGETGGVHLLKRNTKAVNFDMTDIEWDGIYPVGIDFKAPTFNKEKTDIELANYNYLNGVVWGNSDIVMRGSSLVSLASQFLNLSAKPLSSDEQLDALVLFLMNTLTVAETAMTITQSAKEAGISNPSESMLLKLRPLAKKIRNYQEQIKQASTLLAFSQIFIEQMEMMALAAGIDVQDVKTVDTYSTYYSALNYYKAFVDGVGVLSKISGIVVTVTDEDKKKVKDSIAKQYQTLIKDSSDKTVDTILDKTVSTFAKEFKDTTKTQTEKNKLILKYVIEPLAKTFKAYTDLLKDDLKKLTGEEKLKKQRKIDFMQSGYALVQIAKFLFATDDFLLLAKSQPEEVVPVLFDLAGTVLSELITIDNVEVIAKTAYQKATGADGRGHIPRSIKSVAKKGNAYMAAFQTGSGIGNQMIPLIWDLVLGESTLKTSIVDKKISSFGAAKTILQIELNSQKIATYVDGNEFYVAVDEGDVLTFHSSLLRPLLFDELRAPWELNHSFAPTKLYQLSMHTPKNQINTALCIKKVTGDTGFSVNKSLADISISCGEGTLLGGGAFNGEGAYKTAYNSNTTLPDKYKLLHMPQSHFDYISSLQYTVFAEDLVDAEATFVVETKGLQQNAILQKVYLVPLEGNVAFDTDFTKASETNLEVKFSIDSAILANNDVITEVLWQWGDGKQSTNLQIEASHIYSSAGQYTVTITTTRASGQKATITKDIDLSGFIPVEILSAKVTSVTPLQATVNNLTTFTIIGENFPETVTAQIQGADCPAEYKKYISAAKLEIQCQHSGVTTLPLTVVNKSGGNLLVNGSTDINFQALDSSAVPISDGFDYPVGNKGYTAEGRFEIMLEQISSEKNIYTTGEGSITDSHSRGSSVNNTQWRNVSDVGSYVNLTATEGLHPAEDWNLGSGNADAGEAIYAISAGQVVRIQSTYQSGYSVGGWTMILKHKLNDGSYIYSHYTHITSADQVLGELVSNASLFTLKVGDIVTKGQLIARLANGTEMTAGFSAHLHLELRSTEVTGNDMWPEDNGNGYYTYDNSKIATGMTISQINDTFAKMKQLGILDPSDYIDANRVSAHLLENSQVTNINYGALTKGESSTFTIAGENLPESIVFGIYGGSCGDAYNYTATEVNVDCNIPNLEQDSYPFYIAGFTGGVALNGAESQAVEIAVISSLSISNVSIIEGNAGTGMLTFLLNLNEYNNSASVDYATSDATATAGTDYIASSGTVNFIGGSIAEIINITINGDTGVEEDEAFTLTLSNPVNLNLSTTSVTGTISNDDGMTHDGVTYVAVLSPFTGKVWLDRNLGASQVCISLDDIACYGGYYQWGRGADGHEKKTSATSTAQAIDINNAGSKMVVNWTDWVNMDSDGALRVSEWSKVDGSSICPSGYRVPTAMEFEAETISNGINNNIAAFNSFLKLPSSGHRNSFDGSFSDLGAAGNYWVNSVNGSQSSAININYQSTVIFNTYRAKGRGVRCIKGE